MGDTSGDQIMRVILSAIRDIDARGRIATRIDIGPSEGRALAIYWATTDERATWIVPSVNMDRAHEIEQHLLAGRARLYDIPVYMLEDTAGVLVRSEASTSHSVYVAPESGAVGNVG